MPAGFRDRFARPLQRTGGQATRTGDRAPPARLPERRSRPRLPHSAPACASAFRAEAVGPGGLRAIAAMQGVVERQSVVACGDRFLGALQRVACGRHLGGGLRVRVGGDRRVQSQSAPAASLCPAASRMPTRSRQGQGRRPAAATAGATFPPVYVYCGSRSLPPDNRPREKLRRHGAAALGDDELVALVLGSGRPGAGALGMANELLQRRGGLHGLARASCGGELAQVSGVGASASHAAGGRTGARPPDAWACAQRARSAANASRGGRMLLPGLGRARRAVRLRTARQQAPGPANGGPRGRHADTTVVEPRDVFREAMLGAAAAIVVFHNLSATLF